jgi:hypothetical protein
MLPNPGELALLPCPQCRDLLLWTPAHAWTGDGAYRCVNGHSNPQCVGCGSYRTEANCDPQSATLTIVCSECGQQSRSRIVTSGTAMHRAIG